MKMHLKMSSAKWRPFCPGGDELTHWSLQNVAFILNVFPLLLLFGAWQKTQMIT